MLSKLAIAIVTLSVLGSHALSGALYACAEEGTVHRHACCCAGEDRGPDVAVSAAEQGCCTLDAAPPSAPATPAGDATPSVAPAVGTILALVEVLGTQDRGLVGLCEDTPGPAPPDIYLENCALLI